jgi:hypothetical protein
MDEKFVLSIHADAESALSWYERLEDEYAWNARFWEQRALLASGAGKHEKAQSWATTAVSKLRDSYSLNTVGVVLMRRALAEASDAQWPMASFVEAEQYLRESRGKRATGLGRDRAEYPYVTFFHGVLDIRSIVGDPPDQVERMIMDWQLASADLAPSARSEVAEIMGKVASSW